MSSKKISIVLYQPQIPPNTGNIGRLCVGFDSPLYLIKPLGFSLLDKDLKRAGLDYWPNLDVQLFRNFEDFWGQKILKKSGHRVFCLSTKGLNTIEKLSFKEGDVLVFGNETSGFPEDISNRHGITRFRLPMAHGIRSYNLANAVAMSLYAAHISLNDQ